MEINPVYILNNLRFSPYKFYLGKNKRVNYNMKNTKRNMLNYFVLLISLILIVGGIIIGKYGASIVGLLVAAVNIRQIIKFKNTTTYNT